MCSIDSLQITFDLQFVYTYISAISGISSLSLDHFTSTKHAQGTQPSQYNVSIIDMTSSFNWRIFTYDVF